RDPRPRLSPARPGGSPLRHRQVPRARRGDEPRPDRSRLQIVLSRSVGRRHSPPDLSQVTVATSISDTTVAAPSDTVTERLDALEADNQRLRRMTTALFIAAGLLVGLCLALVVVAARRGLPGTIASAVESESFIVKDTDGNVRGAWGVADDGAMR